MTGVVVASAPGKIVLSGEYAVLDGAPAIAMAVERRARARLQSIDGEISQVRAPGFSSECGRFVSAGDDFRWFEGEAFFGLVEAAYRVSGGISSGAGDLELDTGEFMDQASGQKIGIGSSAALTVALCSALSDSADPVEIHPVAARAHANLQGGAGSGVDIACSVHGGLIRYSMKDSMTTALNWPDALKFRVIWTGVAASTRDKLAKFCATSAYPSRAQLADAASEMAGAWQVGNPEQIIEAYRSYTESLRCFSDDHDLGIFDAGHDTISRAIDGPGLSYKPCGAGGGDVGIVFGTDDAELDSFVRKLTVGRELPGCRISHTGVRIEGPQDN